VDLGKIFLGGSSTGGGRAAGPTPLVMGPVYGRSSIDQLTTEMTTDQLWAVLHCP